VRNDVGHGELRVERRMGMPVIGEVFCLAAALFAFNGARARAVGVRNGRGKANRVASFRCNEDMSHHSRHVICWKAGISVLKPKVCAHLILCGAVAGVVKPLGSPIQLDL
jgi:hypothetical protein